MDHTRICTSEFKFIPTNVFAVAVAQIVFPDSRIIHTRNPQSIAKSQIVIGIGGIYDPDQDRFDDQAGNGGSWDDGTPRSNFGLIWKKYGLDLCRDEKLERKIRSSLVIPIDAYTHGTREERRSHDVPSLAHFIEMMNPPWERSNDIQFGFAKALEMAKHYLNALILEDFAASRAKEFVRTMAERAEDPSIVVLSQMVQWEEVVTIEVPRASFVIMPNDPDEWVVQTIPSILGSHETVRKELPASWRGLKGSMLGHVTGVADAKIVHDDGRMAVTRSRTSAVALAKLALAS